VLHASGEVFLEGFSFCWEGLEDPRGGNARLHNFHEVLLIALCSVLCGGQGQWIWLCSPKPRNRCCASFFCSRTGFQGFMVKFSERLDEVIAIDGKTLRRSFDQASSKSALHMVSAWGCEQRLVLGQIATEAKSNEITAVPKLLEMLTLKGATVTGDALLCQRALSEQIVDQGGEYVLALKANQSAMHDDVKLFLEDPETKASVGEPVVERSRDRIETRTATVSTDIRWLDKNHRWPALAAIGKVVRRRDTVAKSTSETAYYLMSAALSPERLNHIARQHWEIENSLHWRLDVIMNEDQDRTRLGNGPHNLAVLRHMAINVMQKASAKGSLRGKFKRAGWNDNFLKSLLALF
jgi:predicted transposase YbfD/YdcC